ncbi:MAG: M50 family metallopeptidase [Bacteroidota bacterium]
MDISNKEYYLYTLPVVVLVINRIPFVGKYLRGVNTLIHESGHAFLALITSGDVYEVELFSDRSGTATTKTSGKYSRFLVAVSGYPFGSAFAFLMFWLIAQNRGHIVLYIVAIIALLNLAMLVRNSYGVFWLITIILLIVVVIFYGNDSLQYVFTLWLSGVMLFESLYSSIELVIIASKKTKAAGDAYNLERFTGIPAMIWALLFVAQAGFFVYLSIKLFFTI